jgi:hypothetical protein
MELFTATGKLKRFVLQLEMFDVCTTSGTAQIETIFKFLSHTRVNFGASIFFNAAKILAFRHGSLRLCMWQELEYPIDMCRVTRGTHNEHL